MDMYSRFRFHTFIPVLISSLALFGCCATLQAEESVPGLDE